MPGEGSYGLIELVLVFGIVLVVACYDLFRTRRELRKPDHDSPRDNR